jgi:glucose/arabinose dehydrogenase
MTERLNRPWGLAFLPDGDILITELPGRLRRIHNGKLQGQIIPGVPKVETQDQAGLMDIRASSAFRRKPSRLPDLFQNRPAWQYSRSGSRPL